MAKTINMKGYTVMARGYTVDTEYEAAVLCNDSSHFLVVLIENGDEDETVELQAFSYTGRDHVVVYQQALALFIATLQEPGVAAEAAVRD